MAIGRRTGATIGSGSSGANTSATVSVPPNVQNNDVMLAVLRFDNTAFGSVTAPSGWSQTNLGNLTQGTDAERLYRKVAASESGSYTWSWANSSGYDLLICAWQGVDTTTPIDVAMTTVGANSGTADVCPAITPATTNSWVVSVLQTRTGAASWTAPSTSPTTSQFGSEGGGGTVAMFDSGPITSPGSVASRTFTCTANAEHMGASVVLRAAGASPSGASVVSGSGSFAVNCPIGFRVQVTGIPANQSKGLGNPNRYFGLGGLSIGSANGNLRHYWIEYADELIVAPFQCSSIVSYSFQAGLSVTITQLFAF